MKGGTMFWIGAFLVWCVVAICVMCALSAMATNENDLIEKLCSCEHGNFSEEEVPY